MVVISLNTSQIRFFPQTNARAGSRCTIPTLAQSFSETMPIRINLGTAHIQDPMEYTHFIQSPYYSDFRLNSLAGMKWEPFQKNWAETMDYAQTKSSFRVYPRTKLYDIQSIQFPAPTYTTTQSPAATTGDSTATIVSQGMRGYQVFLDGNYIGTEGTGGDPLDGRFSFRVVGNQNHDIRVYDGQFNYPKTMFFERGGTKIINVEPGTAVYI